MTVLNQKFVNFVELFLRNVPSLALYSLSSDKQAGSHDVYYSSWAIIWQLFIQNLQYILIHHIISQPIHRNEVQ